MKINTDGINRNQNVDNSTITYSDPRAGRNRIQRGFILDISGNVKDNRAYGGQGKTTEDVAAGMSQSDIVNKHNYMAIMSNSMSKEDLQKMQEEGFHPGSMDVETIVTVVDQIKAKLAEAGVVIKGYTDNLNVEKLEKITKNAGYARSIAQKFSDYNVPATDENVRSAIKEFEKAGEIKEFSESAIKYMIVNQAEPTIENIYKAQFSSGKSIESQGRGYFQDDYSGYYGKKAETLDFSQIQGQVEKIIQDAGLMIYKDTMNQAKWLVESGIPLTAENINLMDTLKNISFPIDSDEIMNAIASALADGKEAKDALLTTQVDLYQRAIEMIKTTESLTEEAVNKTYIDGKSFTIRNIRKALEELSLLPNSQAMLTEDQAQSPELIKAKRQLEEVRLSMTVTANRKLLQSGFSIDTASLEKVVNALKQQEQKQKQILFRELDETAIDEKVNLLEKINKRTESIKNGPADVVGRIAFRTHLFTLNYVHTQSVVSKSLYEQAGETYETMMTAPRADLGDSIKTAFANMDSLLDELNIEKTSDTKRAVRILSYNHMDITEENIAAVKSADASLTRVLEKLTPAATLDMIRDNVNPLNMNIEELYAYLKSRENQYENTTEKYSKFLYKLEKNKDITKEERDTYIGIYRLFAQIEKGDGQAIGSLLKEEREISLENLLEQVRTRNFGRLDVTVDHDFGTLSEVNAHARAIDTQIHSYYKKKADSIYEKLTPEKLKDLNINKNSSLEFFESSLVQSEAAEEFQQDFYKEQIDDMRQVQRVGEEVIEHLLGYDEPVSPNNLLAADFIMNQRGAALKQLFAYARNNDRQAGRQTKTQESTILESQNAVKENFTDEQSAKEAYSRFIEKSVDVLESSAFMEGTVSIDVKSMAVYSRQLEYLSNMAKEENYEVPVEINGEITSINLKILHNKGEKGKVAVTMETKELGKVAASFEVADGKVSGYIGCKRKESREYFEEREQELNHFITQELTNAGVNRSEDSNPISIVYSKDLDINRFGKKGETDQSISTKELYHLAKAFIRFVEQM